MTEEGTLPVRIREASEEDVKELAVLQKAYMLYHERLDDYFAFKANMSELWMDWVVKLLEDSNKVVFCAFVDDRIVGYITGHIINRPPVYQMREVGQIGDVFVLPEYRGQGVFNALFEKVVDWIEEKGMTYVEHAVASTNELGRDVWKKKGFVDFMTFIRKEI